MPPAALADAVTMRSAGLHDPVERHPDYEHILVFLFLFSL